MNESEHTSRMHQGADAERTPKKPYCKPTVCYERVFETTALTCGEVNGTESTCVHNRRAS